MEQSVEESILENEMERDVEVSGLGTWKIGRMQDHIRQMLKEISTRADTARDAADWDDVRLMLSHRPLRIHLRTLIQELESGPEPEEDEHHPY